MDSMPAQQEPRFTELDSLRGVAAMTVVFGHFGVMWLGDQESIWTKLLSPFTAGHEAVLLFFLLSGFVLSVPYLRGRGQSYPVYLLRRILRIYGPYFFALVLALLCAARWHGPINGFGAWTNQTWSQPVSLRMVVEHVLMIGNYDWSQYNTAFWSLVIEMRVSILFPALYLLVGRIGTKPSAALALMMTGCTYLALRFRPDLAETLMTFSYGAVFVWGILLAKHIERANAWYRGLSRTQAGLLAACAFVLYTWGQPISHSLHIEFAGGNEILITAGAAGYMILALNAAPVRRILNSRGALWLGGISYSLYLVHGTVLFALAHIFGRQLGMLPLFALTVLGSLLIGYLFNLAVEEPFLKLSRRVARRYAARQAVLGTQMASARRAA